MNVFNLNKAVLLVAVLCLSACASAPKAGTEMENVADDGPALICTREKILGSNMSKKVCRTKRQVEQEREEMLRVKDQTEVLQPRIGEN